MNTLIAVAEPDLFGALDGQHEAAPPICEFPISYEPIPVRRSTFLNGLSESVHSWFRLTPSFGPDLVRTILEQMRVRAGSHVHDPFSGAGTTAIEATLEGHSATCVEVNPFLHFVGRTCLDWRPRAEDATEALGRITVEYDRNRGVSLDEIQKLGVEIPAIHNLHRWWRADVLRDTLGVKAAIRSQTTGGLQSFFELALAAVLVPDLTNVTLGRLQLHFVDKSKHEMDAWSSFERHAKKMITDLQNLNTRPVHADAKIIHGDSTDTSTFSNLEGIDAVVTSPPYPNRYSYIWNTRPHLYMLDMISAAKEASDIDRKTIGGTWGNATSELGKKAFNPVNQAVADALDGVDLRIRAEDSLMANYVVHYFNRLALHLAAIRPALNPGAKLAYVVGNSWIKGQYVATDVILGRIIERTIPASRVDCLHRFRRRNSGKKLYETIVYATCPSAG